MKSRISFFNGALFRKNVTRFAPAWVLYTIFSLLVMVIVYDGRATGNFISHLGNAISIFAVFNLFYALLVAQLLFGDLYNSRMCNALHALPMRRETWFGTHIVTGLCFSVLPNLLSSLFAMLFLGRYWFTALYFLLGVTLSYLFFFGTAVFAMFCVGNRFAMALVYGIINFLAGLIYWIISVLYQPLIFGITIDIDFLQWFWPVAQFVSLSFLDVQYASTADSYGFIMEDGILSESRFSVVTDNWWYLILCAVVGVALIVLALRLYRRRHLESAGDFVVVKPLAPVFLVLYTLAAGTLLQLLFSLFTGDDSLVFLFIGMAIGFFTGLMLLKRTIRVFSGKAWLQFGGFAAVMALTLLLTWLDPIGFTRYVPETGDVASVAITTNYRSNEAFIAEQENEIEDITSIHQHALDTRLYSSYNNGVDCLDIYLTYTLKNGQTVERTYYIYPEDAMGQLLEAYMSSPEVVLGQNFTDLVSYCSTIERITTETDQTVYQQAHLQSLIAAILADCEAGTMAYDWRFHSNANSYWMDIGYVPERDENGLTSTTYRSLRIWPEATNTMAWLEENGLLDGSVDWDKKLPYTADIEIS